MKRNSLYIILSIITILLLFLTAATCSFCGMQLDTASSEETEEELSGQTEEEPTHMTQETQGSQETVGSEDTAEEEGNHSPSITNVVADEVELDLSDEFRVLAEENTNFLVIASDQDGDELSYAVSDSIGNNMETVKMDNTAAGFGWVAPSEPGLYEIYITVSDGIGKDAAATVHVTVNAIAEAHFLQTERLNIIGSRSGSICHDGDTNGIIYTGDDEENNLFKAYLCFDISSLVGVNISDAQLEIENIRKFGETMESETRLYFFSTDYGDLLDSGDMDVGGPLLFLVSTNGLGESLTQASDSLVNTIQEAIDDGRNWYQLCIDLGNFSSTDDLNDDEKDGYRFLLEGLVLQVNYYVE